MIRDDDQDDDNDLLFGLNSLVQNGKAPLWPKWQSPLPPPTSQVRKRETRKKVRKQTGSLHTAGIYVENAVRTNLAAALADHFFPAVLAVLAAATAFANDGSFNHLFKNSRFEIW